MEYLALLGTKQVVATLKIINQTQDHRVTLSLIIPTFYHSRHRKSNEVLEILKRHFAGQMALPIRANVRLSEAVSHYLMIYEYDPRSYGAADYAQLVERVIEMAKKSDRKVLGNDPFANGDSLPTEEGVGVPEGSGEKPEVEAKVAAEAPPIKVEEESKTEAKPKAKKKAATKAEAKPQAKPVPEQIVAEPDEEASHPLDELIATIDEEVEEVLGPGAMADLAPAEPVGAAGEEQHVIFTLAGTEYAVPIANVIEIGRPLVVTPVPNVPDWVLGVANLRGDILSLVDLRAFLGMEWIGYGQASRMLVAQARQEDMTTGLIVDRVSEIRYLPMDRIGAPAAHRGPGDALSTRRLRARWASAGGARFRPVASLARDAAVRARLGGQIRG
jgi:chemotaxis signal transduction protein